MAEVLVKVVQCSPAATIEVTGMHTAAPKTLGFDTYALDLRRCALLRGSEELQLRPKAFDVLRYLAEHAGRIVSKEELIQVIWPGIFVTDDSLVQCVREIREALGDDAQRIIKTVHRRGYLFAADISEKHGDERAPTIDSRGQKVTFCRTEDGINLAVACVGQGKPLVSIPTWLTHLEYDWQNTTRAPLWHFLAERFRLIRYDGRGFGLSDRDVTDFSFTAFGRDLETIVDALDLRRYALLGVSQGVATAIAHAARHPERVSKMVLHGGFALGRNKQASAEEFEWAKTLITFMRRGWADENSALLRMFSSVFFPGASAEQIEWYAKHLRLSTSPENAIKNRNACDDIDVTDLLSKVSVPTLVLHCRHDNAVPFDRGRCIAASIPNAKFVSLESENHVPLPSEPAWQTFIAEIEAFLSH
jgi:pimeloyl-ACP methyl ester carboxylesterase/DNA-binding winged helix-turn-helix (wHTH) protein